MVINALPKCLNDAKTFWGGISSLVSLASFIEFKFSVCFPTVLELCNIKNTLQWFLFFWLDSYTDRGEKRCEPASEDKFDGVVHHLLSWVGRRVFHPSHSNDGHQKTVVKT